MCSHTDAILRQGCLEWTVGQAGLQRPSKGFPVAEVGVCA